MNTKFTALLAGLAVVLSLASVNTASALQGPAGGRAFCASNPSECGGGGRSIITVSPDLMMMLRSVNSRVNSSMRYVNDARGTDRWNIGGATGDCEDFVLLKRRELIEKGWPAGALLITVVRQTNGEGHAVLTVRSDRGDLVLDNLEPKVKLWGDTEYQFVKRQSEQNSGRWVAIEDDRPTLVGSIKR